MIRIEENDFLNDENVTKQLLVWREILIESEIHRKNGVKYQQPSSEISFIPSNKHNEPHVHVSSQGMKASYSLITGEKIVGDVPHNKEKEIQKTIKNYINTNLWESLFTRYPNGFKIKYLYEDKKKMVFIGIQKNSNN